jgi:heat-inducible transcriptional repressor
MVTETLQDRQRLILKEIVDRYIRLREPVSSRMILEDYGLDVSSATVRNDMNDLEARGYIAKPYSSSGRIPTKKGYRFFVDWLLDLSELTREERHEIVEAYGARCLDIEETIRQTAFVLGNLAGCAGFVIPPRLRNAHLERVVLLKVQANLSFLAVISDIGIVEHGFVPLEEDLTDAELEGVMQAINSDLRGATLDEVRTLATDDGPDGWYERSARQAFVVLGRLLDRTVQHRAHFEGLLNLTSDLQEMVPGEAMARFAELSRALQDEEAFADAMQTARTSRPGIVVNIGDLPLAGFDEFSVVSCSFEPHGGILGVIAPIWMDYGRAMSTTTYIANRLETLLVTSRARRLERTET